MGTGGSGTSPSVSTATPAGRCVGRAKPAYDLNDFGSCEEQGGEWLSEARRCTYGGNTCEAFNDPVVEPDGKMDCGNTIGCAWENPDKTHEVSLEAGGSCTGTMTPCDQIHDKSRCGGRCRWNDAHSSEYCENYGGWFDWTQNATCEELDAALKGGSASPSVVKYRCIGVDGCTWTDGDGTPPGGYVGGGTF